MWYQQASLAACSVAWPVLQYSRSHDPAMTAAYDTAATGGRHLSPQLLSTTLIKDHLYA
jgi:hypothetical protein